MFTLQVMFSEARAKRPERGAKSEMAEQSLMSSEVSDVSWATGARSGMEELLMLRVSRLALRTARGPRSEMPEQWAQSREVRAVRLADGVKSVGEGSDVHTRVLRAGRCVRGTRDTARPRPSISTVCRPCMVASTVGSIAANESPLLASLGRLRVALALAAAILRTPL